MRYLLYIVLQLLAAFVMIADSDQAGFDQHFPKRLLKIGPAFGPIDCSYFNVRQLVASCSKIEYRTFTNTTSYKAPSPTDGFDYREKQSLPNVHYANYFATRRARRGPSPVNRRLRSTPRRYSRPKDRDDDDLPVVYATLSRHDMFTEMKSGRKLTSLTIFPQATTSSCSAIDGCSEAASDVVLESGSKSTGLSFFPYVDTSSADDNDEDLDGILVPLMDEIVEVPESLLWVTITDAIDGTTSVYSTPVCPASSRRTGDDPFDVAMNTPLDQRRSYKAMVVAWKPQSMPFFPIVLSGYSFDEDDVCDLDYLAIPLRRVFDHDPDHSYGKPAPSPVSSRRIPSVPTSPLHATGRSKRRSSTITLTTVGIDGTSVTSSTRDDAVAISVRSRQSISVAAKSDLETVDFGSITLSTPSIPRIFGTCSAYDFENDVGQIPLSHDTRQTLRWVPANRPLLTGGRSLAPSTPYELPACSPTCLWDPDIYPWHYTPEATHVTTKYSLPTGFDDNDAQLGTPSIPVSSISSARTDISEVFLAPSLVGDKTSHVISVRSLPAAVGIVDHDDTFISTASSIFVGNDLGPLRTNPATEPAFTFPISVDDFFSVERAPLPVPVSAMASSSTGADTSLVPSFVGTVSPEFSTTSLPAAVGIVDLEDLSKPTSSTVGESRPVADITDIEMVSSVVADIVDSLFVKVVNLNGASTPSMFSTSSTTINVVDFDLSITPAMQFHSASAIHSPDATADVALVPSNDHWTSSQTSEKRSLSAVNFANDPSEILHTPSTPISATCISSIAAEIGDAALVPSLVDSIESSTVLNEPALPTSPGEDVDRAISLSTPSFSATTDITTASTEAVLMSTLDDLASS